MAGAFKGYGDWINGYGDKLKGVPASSLPKSGPLAQYKAGGTGSTTLKRSSSYGPATSTSKALTKTTSTVTKTGSGAVSSASKTVNGTVSTVGKGATGALSKAKTSTAGLGLPAASVKPYTTLATDKSKDKPLSKTGNAKYPTGSKTPAKSSEKPSYPGTSVAKSTKAGAPDVKRPTPNRAQSYPKSATNASGKVKVSAASRPQPKGYTPYKDPRAEAAKSGGNKGKDAIPLGGIGSESKGGAKGYTPSYAASGDAAKAGGGELGKIDRGFF